MSQKPAPTFAPIYCAMYPDIAKEVKKFGYALAVHGSVARDFDLVCIPWVESAGDPKKVIEALTTMFALKEIGEPEYKLHNRLVYTLSNGFGECFLDLSFMPIVNELT